MENKKSSLKKPWLAAILNLFLGAGYIYLRKRMVFGILLFSVFILSILSEVVYKPVWPNLGIIDLLAGILFFIAFMYDAYTSAKE